MTAGEVLSQSEIDALLAALSAGEMSAEELKKRGGRPTRQNV